MAGRNRALLIKSQYFTEVAAGKSQRPCIFLSHISIDKESAVEIGKYIMENGDLDIYLDTYDEELQKAAKAGNSKLVTRFIEAGLEQSTHVMCLVSKDTVQSWWVPYELGFGKRASKELSTLALKDVENLPAYLEISVILKGTKSLNEYLNKLRAEQYRTGKLEKAYGATLLEHSIQSHPLDKYLNWKL